jgi:hypothetical protein
MSDELSHGCRYPKAVVRFGHGDEQKRVTLSTDFRSPPENGHSRYGRLTGSKKKTALHMLERNISAVLGAGLEGSLKSLRGNDPVKPAGRGSVGGCALTVKRDL